MTTVSFVLPMSNEEEVLSELHRRLDAVSPKRIAQSPTGRRARAICAQARATRHERASVGTTAARLAAELESD
jgi:hypothetical protein